MILAKIVYVSRIWADSIIPSIVGIIPNVVPFFGFKEEMASPKPDEVGSCVQIDHRCPLLSINIYPISLFSREERVILFDQLAIQENDVMMHVTIIYV